MAAVIAGLIGNDDFAFRILECRQCRLHMWLRGGCGHTREARHGSHCSRHDDQAPHSVLPRLVETPVDCARRSDWTTVYAGGIILLAASLLNQSQCLEPWQEPGSRR